MLKRGTEKVKSFWGILGPGFITGAADDDPSGIGTYSIIGAQFGYRLSWLSLFLLPLMISIQEMCARIGFVTGKGITSILKERYSKSVVILTIFLFIIANSFNIGADLGIMAASLEMFSGINRNLWLIVVSAIILALEIFLPYRIYARYLKWLGFTLLVYVATAIIVTPDWGKVISAVFSPMINFDLLYLSALVAFLGTTISPYLFFWQASEEVEERDYNLGKGPTNPLISHLRKIKIDTFAGMFFSQAITFFIILTTAGTLFQSGMTWIETPEQAASALRPLAGEWAYILFTLGIIGVGFQSIPILAGGVGYAVAELFGFPRGLSKKFSEAKVFYSIIIFVTLLGLAFNLLKINPILALYIAAIINGVVAVPLIYLILKIAGSREVMGEHSNRRFSNIFGWATFIFMSLAVIFLTVSLFYRL